MGAGDILKGVGDFFGCLFSSRGAILTAAQTGEAAQVQKLLDAEPGLLNVTDPNGRTALHLAVLKGHQPVVELLLARGAAVNAQDNQGRTPLHAAAFKGHKELAVLLVSHGADVNLKDNDKYTPAQVAFTSKHEDVADAIEPRY